MGVQDIKYITNMIHSTLNYAYITLLKYIYIYTKYTLAHYTLFGITNWNNVSDRFTKR